MEIFDQELDIKDKIVARTTTNLVAPLKISDEKLDLLLESLKNIKSENRAFAKILAKVAENPDLMYGSAILVSTTLNRNDDLFLPTETWEARYTPINTPYNNQHEEKDIIGHIIGTRILDKDGNVVDDDEDIPDFFDIEADWVLYKDIYPELAIQIAKGAEEGTQFVSMEAKLTAFDYGFMNSPTDQQSEIDIVARNKKTSFLTKYLRAYDGPGEFNGRKIVRVLRKFHFSGMGNVDEPANIRSKYTKINNLDGIEEYTKAYFYSKGTIMKIENLDQAMKKIEELEAQLKKTADDSVKTQIDKLTAEKTELTNFVNSEKGKVEVAQQQITALKKELDETKASLEKVNKDLSTKTDELNKLTAESRLTARMDQLNKLGIVVADDKKANFASMTDEAFAQLIDFAQAIGKKKEKEMTDEEKKKMEEEEEKKSKAEKDKKKKEEEEEEAKKKAKAALDAAQAQGKTDVTALVGGSADSEIVTVASKLAAAVIKKRKSLDIKK